jgi:hypothetical protein
MLALHYNIQTFTNAFAHRVTLSDGSTSLADILMMCKKVRNTCYTMAQRFNKLEFKDVTPYMAGGAREDWDPTTGTKKQAKNPAGTTQATTQPGSSNSGKTTTAKPQRQLRYQGSNFDPNYSQRYR